MQTGESKHAPPAKGRAHPMPNGGFRGPRVSKTVMDARVSAILTWLARGVRTSRIYALVDEYTRLEAKTRREALAARASGAEDPPEPPPFVWGDVVPPCSHSQVKRYISKAREQLEAEGRDLSRRATEVLGHTWTMQADLYAAAFAEKRYSVCRAILRDRLETFGLIGAIKVQFVDPNAPGGPAGHDVPESDYTEDQLRAEFIRMVRMGLTRAETDGTLARAARAIGPGTDVAEGSDSGS